MVAKPSSLDFMTLFESCPGLFLVLLPDSPKFTIVGVTQAYLDATKTKKSEILDKGLFEVFPDNPDDPQADGVRKLRSSLNRVIFSKDVDVMDIQKYDIRLPEEEGGGFTEKHWSPTNSPVFGPQSELKYIIHRVEDVTELVRLKQKGTEHEKMEQELRAQRQQLEVLLQSGKVEESSSRTSLARIMIDRMYQFVALLDEDGRLLEMNKTALDGAGLNRTDILGMPFWDLPMWKVTTENPERVRQAHAKALSGQFVRREIDLLAGNRGTQAITIDFSITPLNDGNTSFFLVEGRNITEKKLAEAEIARKNEKLRELNEKLRQLDQLKTEFFANVSHELRTPLALIIGPTHKMLADANLTAHQQYQLEVVHRNAQFLLKHVNDLLDISKLEAKKFSIDYSTFDLCLLIESVKLNFESISQEKNISLETVLPPRLELEADLDKVQRVLFNLVGNAYKFTPVKGKIVISAEQRENEIWIAVSDTGPGIPKHLHESIFERFQQGESSMNRKYGGTGLGLSIAKEFTELHRGSIQVDRQNSKGARFIVKFPRLAPANVPVLKSKSALNPSLDPNFSKIQKPKAYLPEQPSALSKGTILVVEDNADLNQFLVDSLTAQFTVVSVPNGREGLRKALEIKPDLILSDIMMPEMNGEEMAMEIRNHAPLDDVPIILLTAKADDALRVRLLSGFAQDYLVKPFLTEELMVRVGNWVAIKKTKDLLKQQTEYQSSELAFLAEKVVGKTKALQDALEAKDEFLSLASHELKTPLTSLALQLQLMKRKKVANTDLSDGIELSLRHVEMLVKLIDDLLDISSIETNHMQYVQAEVHLADTINDVIYRFTPQIQNAKVALEVDLDDSIVGQWDQNRISQVITNLLTNVLKYAANSKCKIVTRLNNENAVFVIEDQGIGIPKDKQDLIFQRFGRAASRNFGGLGLGLYIVRKIVEHHGGTISVSSDVGKGTQFRIELPLYPQIKSIENSGRFGASIA